MFAGLARGTGSTDRAALPQPPTPLDLTLVPPKRRLEDGAPLDLSVKKPKAAASEDDVSDDVIIVGMQQAPARYCPVAAGGRVPSYYDSSLATKPRTQECGQRYSSGARVRNLNALCTSSPHQRRSASQVEFLRRWSREPGVNICAQAPPPLPLPPRLSESEAAHAYEPSRDSRPHHRQTTRDMTPQPGDYIGRDVISTPVPTSSQQLLQHQLLQQQHHMHMLKQQHQQLQQQRQPRHADMLDRSASRSSPVVCPSPALPPCHVSPKGPPIGVDVSSRPPVKPAQMNASRRPYPGSGPPAVQYDRTVPPHGVHTARTLHSGPYSVIQPAVGDNVGYMYEKEHARTPHPFVPTVHRDRSISGERPLSSAEVEQHIRKSLDHAVSMVQSRAASRQHTPISASPLFPVRPDVDQLRCGTSGSALYRAMLNGSDPIGQPKVATPAGSVPLSKPRDMMKTPVLFRSPDSVPRSRGDAAPPGKRGVPPPLLYSPHLCLPDNRPVASGRRSAEQMRIAMGADGFNHRTDVGLTVSRGSDTNGCDETRRGHSVPTSIQEPTHGDLVASSVTSSQGRGLEQLRHAPYLLSMLTSSQKAELSSSEQYDHVTGMVRRPAGGLCVAGPQDRYVTPYAVPSAGASASQQLAPRKKPTKTPHDAVPRQEATHSSMSGKMANCHHHDSGVEAHAPTEGDAYGRGPAQQTLPSGIRYYKCPKPFTKLPTGDLVSDEKFPSKPIPVANVNPIVKSAYKSGVRAPEYDEKKAGSSDSPGDFSRVSASTFTSGVLATTGGDDTATKQFSNGVDTGSSAKKTATAAKTEYSHKDPPKKCVAAVSEHPTRTGGNKDPPRPTDPPLCSRRDLALYLSTPKGRQKLKLRDNLSNIGVGDSNDCKPTTTTMTTTSQGCVAADNQVTRRPDALSSGDVKGLGFCDGTTACRLTTDAKLSSKAKMYTDLFSTHASSALNNHPIDGADQKPDMKSICPAPSANGDNLMARVKNDGDKEIVNDASLSRGPRTDKFITRKSRILESIRKKSGQQVARMARLKSQHPEKCVKRRKPAEVRMSRDASGHVSLSITRNLSKALTKSIECSPFCTHGKSF
ncbi:hypothetical protein NP493_611g01079 [Ridgeia piscesae]|uniref:Uncharacterized protein n=1 Tax=Ridgeia piscesae TaxID=27915 RepID=A0AAD9KTK5_RIDPI|nr:hypothetical protein NP493_611g01079 [Ridgeia piscesae]